jgi:hypothetical protein
MTSGRSWFRPASAPGLELPLTLAAIVLLLRPMGDWYVQAPLLFIGALSIVKPVMARVPALWLAASITIAVRLAVEWPLPDNHIYLLAYWCLAAALALQGPQPERDLAASSRLLMAGAMTLAVLWKAVLSPDFLDGRFFRVTLIDDPRFEAITMLAGGLTDTELAQNRSALTPLPAGAELAEPPFVHEPRSLRVLAGVLTWGGVGMEALLALSLWIPGQRWRKVQHGLLLAFCLVTYFFAPVAGFGWLLLVMGLCLCRPDQRALRAAYTVAFFVVLLATEVPWARLVLGAIRATLG